MKSSSPLIHRRFVGAIMLTVFVAAWLPASASTVSMSAADYAVCENAGMVRLRVVRDGEVSGASAVQFSTRNGTAADGVDFQAVSAQFTFAPGETNLTVAVALLDNAVTQGRRAFYVDLLAPTGAVLGAQSSATVTILDDEYAAILDPWFEIGTGAADDIFALALQPDGRMIIGGTFITFNGASVARIGRLLPDGSFDGNFDNEGGPDQTVYALALQPDGKIIIGGDFLNIGGVSRAYVARFTPASGFDSTFRASQINNAVRAVAVQSDGKILIAGRFTQVGIQSRNRIARLNANGSVDTTFNPGTGANDSIRALALQPDGRIVIGGQFTSFDGITRSNVARLLTNGLLDASFDPGLGTDDEVRAVAVAPDGKIYIGGDFERFDGALRSAVARLLPTGALDPDFDQGASVDDVVRAIAPLPDGRVWIGGKFTTAGGAPRRNLALLKADGAADELDPGAFDNEVFAIIRQPDGMTVVAGQFRTVSGISMNRIARLNTGHPAPAFDVNLDYSIVNEREEGFWVNVRRKANEASSAEVTVVTRDLSAQAGADYTAVNRTMRFETNETRRRLMIPLNNDGITEPPEQFVVALTNPAPPAVIGGASTALAWIQDNDPGFALSRDNYSSSEAASQAEITVVRGGDPIGLVSVQVLLTPETATPGVDYVGPLDPLVFQPGETQKTFVVTLLADGLAEGTEAVHVSLANPTGGAGLDALTEATLTIDEAASVFRWGQPTPVGEASGGGWISVERSGPVSVSASVDYVVVGGTATPGVDYPPLAGTLHFGPDETNRGFACPVFNDGLVEGGETIVLQLRHPSPGGAVAAESNLVVTIEDNDTGFGFAETNAAVNESLGAITLTVRRDDDGTNALTVEWFTTDGTARAGRDYVAGSGTLYFATGWMSNTITVPILDDCRPNGDPVFTVALRNPSAPGVLGTNAVAVVTIQSNERPGRRDPVFQTDPSFNYDMGLLKTLPVLRGGRIMVVGSAVAGDPPEGLGPVLRLGPDGSLDPTFRCAAGVLSGWLLAVDNKERILTCGSQYIGDGITLQWTSRLDASGSLDGEFSGWGWVGCFGIATRSISSRYPGGAC